MANFSLRRVYWTTQETVNDWVPTATNTAGSLDLATEGILMCGKPIRGSVLIWTTVDLWMMQYIGGEFVWSARRVGGDCGIVSVHAAAVVDTTAFWMGKNGFFAFDGFVKPIPCEVEDYVFGSINRSYEHLIFAFPNPAFSEVTWHYPAAAATTANRYVTYNYTENHWSTGTLTRHAGVAFAGIGAVPVLINNAGEIFDHETGTARNSEGTPSLESGPIELGDGDRLLQIQSVLPDDKTVGDVNLTIYTAPNPDTAETSNGPYTLTARTSIRLKARQVRIKLTEAVANAWRVGTVRLGVVESSRR